LLLYFSFFSRDRNPLHLHSFPTRRSSDLPNCGYTLPKLDLAATSIRLAPDGEGPTHVKLRTPQGEIELDIPLPGLHNVYNATAAIGAAMAAGFDITKAPPALATIRPAFGRLEKV